VASDFDDDDDAGTAIHQVAELSKALRGESPETAYLIVLAGTETGRMVRVTDGLTVGRGGRASFRIQDEGVSRAHIRLTESSDGSIRVEDLGSSNGTFVNGDRIESAQLSDGDKIQIGGTTILKFSYSDELEEKFQQQIYESALHDPLTGLYNRRYFQTQLEAELSYSMRHGVPVSVILLDLDHFKSINDTHGHGVGDDVLRAVAALLKGTLRNEDLAARHGGEEFIVLCRGTPAKLAWIVAERIRHTVATAQIVKEKPELKATVSAGVAAVPSPGVESADALIENADKALYRAKHAGRNRVCVHGE
jgi:diguanylate cyclase (GGDEF)-like protein